MNDNNNFDFRKETREFTAEDGSFIRITGPAFLFEEEDDEEATVDETGDTDHSSENSESVSELPPSITEVPDSAPPSLDLLTVEIKFHLNQMGFHVIEVGKRLLQAKTLVPHGDWANWLKNNFNLSQESARKFMRCSEKFGKSTTSWILKPSQMFELLALPEGDEQKFIAEKSAEGHGEWANWLKNNFNLSQESARKFMRCSEKFGKSTTSWILKPSQMFELLALPEGDEQKFIAEKSAEGKAVADMTIKNLREEIKQWKEKFAISQSRCDRFFQSNSILQNELRNTRMESDAHKARADSLASALALQKTVIVPPSDYESLQKENEELRNRPIDVAIEFPDDYEPLKNENATLKAREESFKHDYAARVALQQIFDAIPAVLNSDNLQNIIADFSSDDLTSFKIQLDKLLSLLSSFDSNH